MTRAYIAVQKVASRQDVPLAVRLRVLQTVNRRLGNVACIHKAHVCERDRLVARESIHDHLVGSARSNVQQLGTNHVGREHRSDGERRLVWYGVQPVPGCLFTKSTSYQACQPPLGHAHDPARLDLLAGLEDLVNIGQLARIFARDVLPKYRVSGSTSTAWPLRFSFRCLLTNHDSFTMPQPRNAPVQSVYARLR